MKSNKSFTFYVESLPNLTNINFGEELLLNEGICPISN